MATTKKERKVWVPIFTLIWQLSVMCMGFLVALMASGNNRMAIMGSFIAGLSCTVWMMMYALLSLIEDEANEVDYDD